MVTINTFDNLVKLRHDKPKDTTHPILGIDPYHDNKGRFAPAPGQFGQLVNGKPVNKVREDVIHNGKNIGKVSNYVATPTRGTGKIQDAMNKVVRWISEPTGRKGMDNFRSKKSAIEDVIYRSSL